jgi:formylglycine-generating enzyme required for sulfatase activity
MRREMFVRSVCAFLCIAVSIPVALAANNGDVPVNTTASARRMIEDLAQLGDDYPQGSALLARLETIEGQLATDPNDGEAKTALQELIREAAIANPLLDFDRILVVRRNGQANRNLNAYTSDTIKRTGWNNELAVLSNLRGEVQVDTLYKPESAVLKHADVHFGAEKILFSSVGENGNWGVLQIDADGQNLTELTPSDQDDVQWFDGIYLPEENMIAVCSTAGMQGLPCVNGGQPMTNLYRVNTETGAVRQLTFEQDSDWHPRVMDNGSLMYLRWEYTDTPHYYSRYLFTMRPDGTGQMELWGSGSYFPTAYTWAKPIPGRSTMAVGCVSAHHGTSETGRMMLVDWSLSRKYPLKITPEDKIWGAENSMVNIFPDVLPAEQTGCVQEIPGWGRDVVGNVRDAQGDNQTYTFQTPWPLSDKYFLVSLRGCPTAENRGRWSLCLVDVFDNMTVLYEDDEYSDVFEPIPLVAQETPPVLPDMTNEEAPSTVFCTNVYDGRGLEGIPFGEVKSLRVISYHYGYMQSGGHESCGLESSWDIKRIHGTVPVEEDGSVWFEVPPNTPLAIQPLDENGAALALMRSWMVAMPGETLSCNGCHENLNEVTPPRLTTASRKAPQEIQPWYGPTRPFGYAAEIQPLLDEYCVGCHTDEKFAEKGRPSFEKGHTTDWRKDRSYLNLVAFTRRPGPESDLDMYGAMEWHVTTSPLIQMFRKGHNGVELSDEAWDRLITWIDLNAPHRGMWINEHYEQRRLDLGMLYAGVSDNPEEEFRIHLASIESEIRPEPIMPPKLPRPEADGLSVPNFPFTPAPGAPTEIELADGVSMSLAPIPAGQFVMGSQSGSADEAPRAVVAIDSPFLMGVTEVTNRQYRAFNPEHDTRYLDETGKDHAVPGYIANHPDQPVARVTWQDAMQFCAWLSDKTGKTVMLPTEAQWEWAARAGSDQQFYYGDQDTDFSTFANLADAERRRTYVTWDGGSKIHIRRDYPADYLFPLRDDRFKDNWFVVDFVAQCEANPFGLQDIVGNVNEWTRSSYRAYPYNGVDGRNEGDISEMKVARGGSWADRPKDAGSTVRYPYESYQTVYNVGFRVIIEE